MVKLDKMRDYARLIDEDWEVLSTVPYGRYVEVGTYKGASACAASINADSVVTIDIFDWQPKVYETIYPEVGNKIIFLKGTSVDYAAQLVIEGSEPTIDVLFIDGAHEYEYVTMDCEALVPHVKRGGTVLFHDHNPNNPVTRVYEAVNKFLETISYKTFPKIGSSNLLHIEIL